MYSFSFPNMLGFNGAKLVKDKEAVKSNLRLVLLSERGSHFGDPYFGTTLKKVIYEQASSIVVDLLIDRIHVAITTFIPQIALTRNDITLTTDGTCIYASIQYVFLEDNTSDLYTINLTDPDEA